jgi:hypothetical protein
MTSDCSVLLHHLLQWARTQPWMQACRLYGSYSDGVHSRLTGFCLLGPSSRRSGSLTIAISTMDGAVLYCFINSRAASMVNEDVARTPSG